jgi:Kelch motif/Galactose oxidase, central domain
LKDPFVAFRLFPSLGFFQTTVFKRTRELWTYHTTATTTSSIIMTRVSSASPSHLVRLIGLLVWSSVVLLLSPLGGGLYVVDAQLTKPTEEWQYHPTKLIKPISDQSATIDPNTGRVYLVGGCNNTDGNIRLAPGNGSDFTCPDVTDRSYVFDITTGKIESLPSAPHKRYRHAAIFHNGLVWLFGGRDAGFNETAEVDNLVYNVDVFDTTTNSWRTDLTFRLDDSIARSDGSAFVIKDTIYLVGGYELGYNATKTTIAIDIAKSISSKKTLSWSPRADLIQARGDCYAEVVNGVAYIVGGFTHLDFWCEALDDVERYRPADDKWERLSESQSLVYERADKAVVTVGTRLYVIGGEYKTDCSAEPSQRTGPTTEVEVFDTADGDAATWKEEIADIPADHFRFPAVSYKGVIYTFGGQNYYNTECDCFPASNVILTFNTTNTVAKPSVDAGSGGGGAAVSASMTVIPAVTTMWATLLLVVMLQ